MGPAGLGFIGPKRAAERRANGVAERGAAIKNKRRNPNTSWDFPKPEILAGLSSKKLLVDVLGLCREGRPRGCPIAQVGRRFEHIVATQHNMLSDVDATNGDSDGGNKRRRTDDDLGRVRVAATAARNVDSYD